MKSPTTYLLAWILLLGSALSLPGQRQVLAMPSEEGVWVRWTEPDLKTSPSLNVYRQDAGGGDWEKLTEKPFSYGQADLSGVMAQNAAVKNAKDIADALRKQNKMEGIGLALVLTTAVESREFSSYLGIIYLDKTAQAGKEYRYEVREVSGGTEKSYGQSASVKAGKLVPGKAVEQVRTQEGDGKLSFSWSHDPARLTGANVYQKAGSSWKAMNSRLILPTKVVDEKGDKAYPEWFFIADSLQNGTTYTCIIKGVDLFGFETEASAEFKLTPMDKTAPRAPSKYALALDRDKVTLTWELPIAKDVAGINVYRQRDADTNWVKRNKQPLPPNARRYDEVVEEMGHVYSYLIASVDKAGNENRTESRIADVRDLKPPVVVRNLKAVADTGVIRLSWFPNPEKDLWGYNVYRMARTATGGDTIQITARPVTSPAYNDTLPKVAKNTFAYWVTAVDTNFNESPKSAVASAVLPDPMPPQAPTLKAIRKDGEGIRIVWLPNMETDLDGYLVYRSTRETGPDSIWKALTLRPLSAKDTAFSDRDIEPGQAYYYSVAALDNSGNRSVRSAPFMGSVTTMRLRAVPQELAIKHGRGKSEATLTWTLPKTDDVIGCMVYRKQGKDAFLPISGLLQEGKAIDSGLKKGETYYYEVRAFDKAGNYSKSAQVTLTLETE